MSITKEQAVSWANGKIGQKIDYDGVYGAQCMDLVVAFCMEHFGWHPTGNARDLVTQGLPAGFKRYQNTADFLPLPGDIFIWAHDQYGHTGIITSATMTSYTSVEQNGQAPFDGSGPARAFTRSYTNFWGVIRPPYIDSKPQGPYIAYEKYVTITKKGYSLWSSFSWNKKDTTDNLFNQTLLAKGYYNHSNGARYYSLYTDAGEWKGYLNAEAAIVAKETVMTEIQEYRMLHKDQKYTIDTLPWGEKGFVKLGNTIDYLGKIVRITQQVGAYYYTPELKGWVDNKAFDTVEKVNQALTIKNGGYQINPLPWYSGVQVLGNTKDHIGKKVTATGKKDGYYYIANLGWIDQRAF